jgi:hypothetical protein
MPSNPAFAIQLSLIRLACAADLLEQTYWSQLLKSCSEAFRAARRLMGRFRGRKLVGSGQYSKCFFAGGRCLSLMPCYLLVVTFS